MSSPAWAAKGLRIGTGFGPGIPVLSGGVADECQPQSGLAFNVIDWGYGFTDAFSINSKIIGIVGSTDEGGVNWGFGELAFDARYAFMTNKALNPFVMLGFGISSFSLEHEDDWRIFSNPVVGLDLGVGYEYYLGSKKRWSLGGQLYYHLASYRSGEKHYCYTTTEEDVSDVLFPEGIEPGEIDKIIYIDEDFDVDANGGFFIMLFNVSYTWRK